MIPTAGGKTPEGLLSTIKNQIETGNQMEIPAQELSFSQSEAGASLANEAVTPSGVTW